MRREWIEISSTIRIKISDWSPSMRREWIEMTGTKNDGFMLVVSLHAEGVD